MEYQDTLISVEGKEYSSVEALSYNEKLCFSTQDRACARRRRI